MSGAVPVRGRPFVVAAQIAAKSVKTRADMTRGELGVDFVGLSGLGLPCSGVGFDVLAIVGSYSYQSADRLAPVRRSFTKYS